MEIDILSDRDVTNNYNWYFSKCTILYFRFKYNFRTNNLSNRSKVLFWRDFSGIFKEIGNKKIKNKKFRQAFTKHTDIFTPFVYSFPSSQETEVK